MKQPLLLFLFSLLTYITQAQTNQGVQYVGKIYAGIGLVTPKNSVCYSEGIGFSAFKDLSSSVYAETGIGVRFLQLPGYKNSAIFRSSWTNGEYESYVSKTAEINQVFLQVPVNFFYRINKLSVGLGLTFDYLAVSRTSQAVSGTYSNPDYAGSEVPLTRSIKYVYTIDNDKSLNNYTRTNISPQALLGINTGKRIQAMIACSYTVFANPIYNNLVVPYRLLTSSIHIYFKL